MVSLSEKLDAGTTSNATFRMTRRRDKKPVVATVTYDAAQSTATFRPRRVAVYTATVTTGIEDLAGNPLAVDEVWRFKVR